VNESSGILVLNKKDYLEHYGNNFYKGYKVYNENLDKL
jgi:hypothetical protein